MHVAIQDQEEMPVHFKKQVQVETLLFNKALTKVLAEYFDYNNIFSTKYVVKLSENTGMNEHTIKLEEDKQLLFGPIYSLRVVELETLKIYIKTNLANDFIQLFKATARALILFNKKPNRNFYLCVDY